MPWVPDFEAYCEPHPTSQDCLYSWCQNPDNIGAEQCDSLDAFCADEPNASSAKCVPPCDNLEDPDSDTRCQSPDS